MLDSRATFAENFACHLERASAAPGGLRVEAEGVVELEVEGMNDGPSQIAEGCAALDPNLPVDGRLAS
jgi:hypothetical protein